MSFKFFLGVVLLAGLLIGCLVIGYGIGKIETPVSHQVENAAELAQNGDLQKAIAALKKAKNLWDDHREALAAFSDHGPMDEIDTLLTETLSYGASGLLEKFLAGCRQLRLLLESIVTEHRLTWWNLL